MIKQTYVFVLCLLFIGDGSIGMKTLNDETVQLILDLMEHFKKIDESELPVRTIADPYPVENTTQSYLQSTFTFHNMMAYGLRKVEISHISVDLFRMKIDIHLKFKKIRLEGGYMFRTGFYSTNGPFSFDFENIEVFTSVNLEVDKDGKLRMNHKSVNLSYEEIYAKFGNHAFLQTIMQNVFSLGVGSLVLKKIGQSAIEHQQQLINKFLDERINPLPFINSIEPFDYEIHRLESKVNHDIGKCVQIRNYTDSGKLITVNSANTRVRGLSVVCVGDLSVLVENETLISSFSIATDRFKGFTDFEIDLILGSTNLPRFSFGVSYINANVSLSQSLDTRKHPKLKDLSLDLGKMEIRCNGLGIFGYLIELVVNFLLNLMHYQIVDSVETAVKYEVQDKFDTIDVEKVLKQLIHNLNTDHSNEINRMHGLLDFGNLTAMPVLYGDPPHTLNIFIHDRF